MFRSVILARRLRCAATPLLHSVVGAAAAVGRRIEIRASTLSLSKIPTSFLSLAFALTPRVDSLRVGRRMTQQQHQYAQAPQFWLNQQQPYGAAPALAAPVPGGADEVRSLWIGDLQNWMDENYLTYCFYYTGQLVSTKIIRNKQTAVSEGYGFLEFTSRAVAESVLHMYNGTLMPYSEQSFFRLNWARGTRDKPTDNSPEHTIFVGGLAPDVTDYVLQETFKQVYKSVKGAKVITDRVTGYSKRFGFVKFADEKEQQRAIEEMDGVVCSTRKMKVGPVTNKAAPVTNKAAPTQIASLGKDQQQTPQQQQYPPQQWQNPHQPAQDQAPQNWQLLHQPYGAAPANGDYFVYNYEFPWNLEDFIDDNFLTKYGADPFSGFVYLWIGNLDDSMDDTYLTNFFNNYGLVSAKVFRNKQTSISEEYGLLEFSSFYSAAVAMSFVSSLSDSEQIFYLEWANCERQEYPRFFNMKKTKRKQNFMAYRSYQQPTAKKDYNYSYFWMQGKNDPKNTTVFVGDLDPSVTHDHLKQLFSRFGEVVHVKILVRRRLGFVIQLPLSNCVAFVEFADRSCAELALSNLNGIMLGGHNIRLSWGLVPSNAIIWVGFLDRSVTCEYLKQAFSQYGEVVHVNKQMSENSGHVLFAKWSCAEEAFSTLDGTMLGSQKIRLKWESISSLNMISFHGLDPSVTEDYLEQVFSQYGELVDVKVHVNNTGWVEFAEWSSAEQGFSSLNHTIVGGTWELYPSNNIIGFHGLDPSVTEDYLKQVFSQCGELVDVKVHGNTGWVRFAEWSCAEQSFSSLNHTMVGGTWELYPSFDTIWFDNLDPSVTVDDLKQLFSKFGEVVEVTTNVCMNYGFVQFAERCCAEQAISASKGVPTLGDHKFKVRLFLDYPSSKQGWSLGVQN